MKNTSTLWRFNKLANCPACNSEVDEMNPAVISKTLEANYDWDDFESDSDRYGYPEGKTFDLPGYGYVQIVKKSTGYNGDHIYDGEIPQGTEFETFIIFEVAGRFFRKEGNGDSYGEVEWNGPFKEVFPQTKTVVVYDFNDINDVNTTG